MTSTPMYPIVLDGNQPPLLNEHDLVRYVREMCGYEVAEAVKTCIVGMDESDLDDIESASNGLSAIYSDFEDALGELKDAIKNTRTRLNM